MKTEFLISYPPGAYQVGATENVSPAPNERDWINQVHPDKHF